MGKFETPKENGIFALKANMQLLKDINNKIAGLRAKLESGGHKKKFNRKIKNLKMESRRAFLKIFVGGSVIAGATAGTGVIGINLIPSGETETDLNDLREALTPFTQPNFNVTAPFTANLIKQKEDLYYKIEIFEEMVKELKYYAVHGTPENNQNQNSNIKRVLNDIFSTSFFDELETYKKENAINPKTAHLLLIPQQHATIYQGGDPNLTTTRGRCAHDIKNILRVLQPMNPKIFEEGTSVKGRVTKEKMIKAVLEQMPPHMQNVSLIVERVTTQYDGFLKGGHHEWQIDPQYRVYGADHKDFLNINMTAMEMLSATNLEYMGKNFGLYYMAMVNGLIREQFMIEKLIATLKEDETGILVVGASHIPAMKHCLAKKHPNVKAELVIPRHLF